MYRAPTRTICLINLHSILIMISKVPPRARFWDFTQATWGTPGRLGKMTFFLMLVLTQALVNSTLRLTGSKRKLAGCSIRNQLQSPEPVVRLHRRSILEMYRTPGLTGQSLI